MNSYDTVAHFAHIMRPPRMSKTTFRMVKLRYKHAALRRLVEPLIKMGLFGQEMLDPTGVRRKVFPRLLAVIADTKEKWELLCLYANGSVNRPCPACTDTKEFSRQKTEKIIEGKRCVDSSYRTRGGQTQIASHSPQQRELGQLWSTHSVVSALYDLPGAVDIHEKVPHETMHSNSLGLTREIVKAILPYAESIGQNKKTVAERIDERIQLIPRYQNLDLPTGDEYVQNDTFALPICKLVSQALFFHTLSTSTFP